MGLYESNYINFEKIIKNNFDQLKKKHITYNLKLLIPSTLCLFSSNTLKLTNK